MDEDLASTCHAPHHTSPAASRAEYLHSALPRKGPKRCEHIPTSNTRLLREHLGALEVALLRRLRCGAPRIALRARPPGRRVHGAAFAGNASAVIGVQRLVCSRSWPPPVEL